MNTNGIPMSDKHIVDVIVATATVGGFLSQTLPLVGFVLTITWTAIRIWETKTVQKLFGREDTDNE